MNILNAYQSLNDKEKAVVDEYVDYCIDLQKNKKERILNALSLPVPEGYARRFGKELDRPLVTAAIAERIKEESEKQDINPDRVIKEMAVIAFSQPQEFLYTSDTGVVTLRDLDSIPAYKMGAVKSVETKMNRFGIPETKIVFHDKLSCLVKLAEMMGLVAPEKPAPLKEYVAPVEEKEILTVEASKAYERLLESVDNG